MKKLFLSLIALVLPLLAGAQVSDIRTATLIHENETKVYYGADAFKDAYSAAAKKGDVIVLSSGTFNNADKITKSISIYGAGYETDTITGTGPTCIPLISILSTKGYDDYGQEITEYPTVYLEGIYLTQQKTWLNSYQYDTYCFNVLGTGTIENMTVRKCKFAGYLSIPVQSSNCRFIQCVMEKPIGSCTSTTGCTTPFLYNQSQLSFENCYISNSCGGSMESTILYNHCIILTASSGYAHYTNNIIARTLPENCTAYNNIFISTSIGTNVTGENNWVNIVTSGIFEPDNGLVYSATNNYIIRFPKKYVGTDGTEVGINGGSYPFNRLSSVPRILQSDIDLTTTEDKKLNVSIKVEAQTK